MAKFIVTVIYRVNTDLDDTEKDMEKVEAQRWEMFQKKYELKTLLLKVEKLHLRG